MPGHLPLQCSESYRRLYEPEFVMVCVCVSVLYMCPYLFGRTSLPLVSPLRAHTYQLTAAAAPIMASYGLSDHPPPFFSVAHIYFPALLTTYAHTRTHCSGYGPALLRLTLVSSHPFTFYRLPVSTYAQWRPLSVASIHSVVERGRRS